MERLICFSHPISGPGWGGILTVPPRSDNSNRAQHTHTIILLQDRGSRDITFSDRICEDEKTFDGITLWELFPTVKWVFPVASSQYSTALKDTTPQWFDDLDTDRPWKRPDLQRPGLDSSFKNIRDIIHKEAAIISSKNIILGGMEQGAALALAMFISTRVKLGGYVGISAFMPLLNCSYGVEPEYKGLKAVASPTNLTTPICFVRSRGNEEYPDPNAMGKVKALEEIVHMIVQYLSTMLGIPKVEDLRGGEGLGWAGRLNEYDCGDNLEAENDGE